MMQEGYTKVPNSLFDWLLASSSVLSKRELVVILAVIRNTIGWRRETSAMSCRYISKATGLDPGNVSKAIKQLEEMRIITVDRSTGTAMVTLVQQEPGQGVVNSTTPVVNSTTGVLSNQQRGCCQNDNGGVVNSTTNTLKDRHVTEKNTDTLPEGLF